MQRVQAEGEGTILCQLGGFTLLDVICAFFKVGLKYVQLLTTVTFVDDSKRHCVKPLLLQPCQLIQQLLLLLQ